MSSLFKIGFIVIAGIFIVAVMRDAGLSFGEFGSTWNNEPSYDLTERDTYLRSYDADNDGVVDDTEYREGELYRIESKIEELEGDIDEAKLSQNLSPYAGKVEIQSGNTWTDVRNEEYVRLSASSDNETPIPITGWVLKSLVTDRGAKIGKGVRVLMGNRPWFSAGTMYLAPGDEAVVSTGGAAGIRTSFLVNKCIGYFGNENRFIPSLYSECPLLEEENLSEFDLAFDDFDDEDEYDECMDAIEDVGQCERGSAPSDVVKECRAFIREYSNYEGCVKLHKNDSDFLKDEWRIFLNANRNDLWRDDRETIGLFDAQGKLVDVWQY
ncbi:MAG: hypothetical protein AAB460_01395 [Patescibacteria group bacterium]